MKIAVSKIEEAPRVQVRLGSDKRAVTEYAEAFEAGAEFPPIVVFNESGTDRYVVSDGHHRLQAALQAGIEYIEADLREGGEAAALEFALGANQHHGLRMRDVDRKRAFALLMSTPALERKYGTNKAKADLLGISERQLMRIKGDWRESSGGGKREREKKQTAQDTAAKHNGHDTRHVPEKPKLTPEQRKIASQVRESMRPEQSLCPHCKGTGLA